ncbi:MAG: hypothetical protein QG564_634 [Campylobacterota bacterium]|nr:hypothetical protein [Campylobacterota bacterium]
MSIKRYQNELIVLVALFMMSGAYLYKYEQVFKQAENANSMKRSVDEFRETVALQKIWGNKNTASKVDQLQGLIPESKVKWSKTGKKLTAIYENLSASELNKLVTKILNLAVEIEALSIHQSGSVYRVELRCKW